MFYPGTELFGDEWKHLWNHQKTGFHLSLLEANEKKVGWGGKGGRHLQELYWWDFWVAAWNPGQVIAMLIILRSLSQHQHLPGQAQALFLAHMGLVQIRHPSSAS